MIHNINRIGNLTSSNIFKIMGAPAPMKTYLTKKNLERKLNKSIETEAYSQAIAWGNFMEQRVFELLGMEFELCSDKTDLHPSIKWWAGSKDLIVKGVKIGEIKCFELENFAEFSDVILQKNTEIFKKEYPKEYWQIVSNAIINGVPNGEAIAYCPFESELAEIQQMASDYRDADAWKYRFIYEKDAKSLPHLEDGGYYNNLNRFEFEIPQEDRDALTAKVLECGPKLIPFYDKSLIEC